MVVYSKNKRILPVQVLLIIILNTKTILFKIYGSVYPLLLTIIILYFLFD